MRDVANIYVHLKFLAVPKEYWFHVLETKSVQVHTILECCGEEQETQKHVLVEIFNSWGLLGRRVVKFCELTVERYDSKLVPCW